MSGTDMGSQTDERVDTPGGEPSPKEYPADAAKAALTKARRRGNKRGGRRAPKRSFGAGRWKGAEPPPGQSWGEEAGIPIPRLDSQNKTPAAGRGADPAEETAQRTKTRPWSIWFDIRIA